MSSQCEDESAHATQLPEFFSREVDAEAEVYKKACGECCMKSFIKANIRSILRPFADHVDDLQKTVNMLNSSLLNVVAKQGQYSETLDDHTEKIWSLQTELNCTGKLTSSMQAALEVLSSERQLLTEEHAKTKEEHAKTKANLENADERLTAVQSAIAELQSGLKGARTSLGRLRESVRKMEGDTTSKVLPTIEQLTSDLENLDMAHSTTAQSVHDTKLFTNHLNQALQIFEEKNDQRNVGHDRNFQHVEDSFTKLERTLKDMRDVTQLQSERLNNTDGVIGPMKMQLHNLEIAREEGKRRLNENDLIITELKISCRTMDVNVAKLTEYYEDASGGEDRFTMVGSLERMLAQNTENIKHLLDTTEEHTNALRKSNSRTTNLEKAINKLQDQACRWMECVPTRLADAEGLGNGTSICSRDKSKQSSLGGSESAVGVPTMPLEAHPTSIGPICGGDRSGHSLLGVVDSAVGMAATSLEGSICGICGGERPRRSTLGFGDSAVGTATTSLDALPKRIHETVQNHGDEVARSKNDPAKTLTQLETTEHRVSLMENQVKVTQDDLKNIRAGLDLSHSYWKGLTRGFKDMKAEANQEGKMLPSRANLRLPAMVWDPSR